MPKLLTPIRLDFVQKGQGVGLVGTSMFHSSSGIAGLGVEK